MHPSLSNENPIIRIPQLDRDRTSQKSFGNLLFSLLLSRNSHSPYTSTRCSQKYKCIDRENWSLENITKTRAMKSINIDVKFDQFRWITMFLKSIESIVTRANFSRRVPLECGRVKNVTSELYKRGINNGIAVALSAYHVNGPAVRIRREVRRHWCSTCCPAWRRTRQRWRRTDWRRWVAAITRY